MIYFLPLAAGISGHVCPAGMQLAAGYSTGVGQGRGQRKMSFGTGDTRKLGGGGAKPAMVMGSYLWHQQTDFLTCLI